MFVKNKASIDFKYRKSGYLAILKAGTVSYVDESKVSARELIGCYGQRIDVISRDLVEEIAPHAIKEEKAALKEAIKKEAPKAKEIVKKEELNDSFIEKVLGEIEKEEKAETKTPAAPKKEEKPAKAPKAKAAKTTASKPRVRRARTKKA